MSFEIKVTEETGGVKPKNFLKKRIDVPYFKIPKLIKNKRITLNGKKIKEDDVLKSGDIIKVWPNEINPVEKKKRKVEKKDLKIPIIYEDDNILVFNKLPGVIVQGAQDNETSLSLHLAHHKSKIVDTSDFDYFHVHRLDKDTSGVLVVAKNLQSLRELNKVFRQRDVVKKYVCLCVGRPDEESGKVDEYLRRSEQGVREKVQVCSKKDADGKKSLSFYKVVAHYEHDLEDFSLVEVEIKTGITHQIRVHMKHLGCPVFGDRMYGNLSVNRKYEEILDRQFLHAKYLEFEFKGKRLKFEAPITQDLSNMITHISN